MRQWLGFTAFINRPWFSRAWVVQELALCRAATVVCGDRIIPWSQLSRTIEFVRATKWYHHLSTEKLKHLAEASSDRKAYKKLLISKMRFGIGPMYLNHTRAALQSSLKGTARKSPSLRRLLDSHRPTNATDPRDKVYAFLSLANRGLTLKNSEDFIRPDY